MSTTKLFAEIVKRQLYTRSSYMCNVLEDSNTQRVLRPTNKQIETALEDIQKFFVVLQQKYGINSTHQTLVGHLMSPLEERGFRLRTYLAPCGDTWVGLLYMAGLEIYKDWDNREAIVEKVLNKLHFQIHKSKSIPQVLSVSELFALAIKTGHYQRGGFMCTSLEVMAEGKIIRPGYVNIGKEAIAKFMDELVKKYHGCDERESLRGRLNSCKDLNVKDKIFENACEVAFSMYSDWDDRFIITEELEVAQ